MEDLLLYISLDEFMTFISLSFGILTPIFMIGCLSAGIIERTSLFPLDYGSAKINPVGVECLPFIPVRRHFYTIRSSLESETADSTLFFPPHQSKSGGGKHNVQTDRRSAAVCRLVAVTWLSIDYGFGRLAGNDCSDF